MVDPIYHGEVRLLNWGESARTGMSATVQLDDGPDGYQVHPLKGFPTGAKSGQRFAMVLVPIGDDEQPVQQPKPKGGKRAQRAAMLGDQQYWPAIQEYTGTNVTSADEAADAIRRYCEVWSRTGLDHDKASADLFDELEREVKALTPLQDNPYDR